MKIVRTIAELRQSLQQQRLSGKKTGLVPTMGALHAGHLSLFETSARENDFTSGSIFVNPLQFNNPEDLQKYPRNLEKDLELLKNSGCDLIFAPDPEEVYPEKPLMQVSFGSLETTMEGSFRPGHFSGVGIVVSKLFNLFQPDKAYFGQKDLQQFLIIKRLVKDLSFPLELVCCPTLREKNGLAMSSRNQRLSEKGKEVAANLYKTLQLGERMLKEGKSLSEARSKMNDYIKAFSEITPEYIEIADTETLQSLNEFKGQEAAICIAANVDGVRLIDNIIVNLKM